VNQGEHAMLYWFIFLYSYISGLALLASMQRAYKA
jgi:hypothetical protein